MNPPTKKDSTGNATKEGSFSGKTTEADSLRNGLQQTPVVVTTATEIMPGTRIDRYVVLDSKLGEGGMGVVYTAYDPELDRKVALKLLSQSSNTKGKDSSLDPSGLRLLREAQAMARLSHPNVVSVFDAGSFQGRVFIAMDLVEGKTLGAWLEEKQRTWREIVAMFIGAGKGLEAAHAAGLVHRDFKPGNVLVTKEGVARVTDFGLARLTYLPEEKDESFKESSDSQADVMGGLEDMDSGPADSDSAHLLGVRLTRMASWMGTPRYMAPEQIHEDALPDPRADQYSFCVAMYEALRHGSAFGGRNMDEHLTAKREGRIKELPRKAHVPARIRRLLLRGLRPRPEDRFESIRDLLRALQATLDRERARRNWLIALASAGLLSGGLLFYRMETIRTEKMLCSGSQELFREVWNDAGRNKIREKFLATGKPYAAAVFSGVEKVLDGYQLAWAGVHQEACRATRIRGEQTEQLLQLQVVCLNRRLSEVRSLLAVFADADEDTIKKASQAVSEMVPVANCSNVAALTAPIVPPRDATMALTVGRLREQLDHAKALGDTGKIKASLELLEQIHPKIRELGYHPVEAESLLLYATYLAKTRKDEQSTKASFDAFVFAQAGGDDRTAAGAATLLVKIWGTLRTDYTQADNWAQIAKAILERVGGDARTEAKLNNYLGGIAYYQGRLIDAQKLVELSIEQYKSALDPNSLGISQVTCNLAALLTESGDLPAAIKLEETELEKLRQILGQEHPEVLTVLSNLGRAYATVGRLKEALQLTQRAAEIARQELGARSELTLWANTNQALALELSGAHAEAETLLRAILRLSQDYGGTDSADRQNILASALLHQGKSIEASQYYLKSINMLEKQRAIRHELLDALLGMAQIEQEKGQTPSARKRLDRALELIGMRSFDPAKVARIKTALAQLVLKMDHDKLRARTLAEEARAEYVKWPYLGAPPQELVSLLESLPR